MPLIPSADRAEQITRWEGIGRRLFPNAPMTGFWPPEMGFCMELIPLLRAHGCRYVLVDSEHVEPVTPMRWEQLRYRPHVARHGGAEIVVVVRDRELSDAQEAGMDAGWFIHEVSERTKWCDFPPLVTTCSDGDNGGWFRTTSPEANFWSAFHDDLLSRVARGDGGHIRPTFIHEYLEGHGTDGFWGEAWVPRSHADLDLAAQALATQGDAPAEP